MKFNILLIALLLMKFVYSQPTFFTQIQGTNTFNFPSDFVVKPDNNILFMVISMDYNSRIFDNNLYEVSPEGEMLNIYTFLDTTSVYVHFTHIINVDDTLYLFGWGQKNQHDQEYPYLLMKKMDMQLNELSNYEINVESLNYKNDISHGEVKFSNETFFYLASTGDGGGVVTCFIAEISKNGELLALDYDDETSGVQIPYDFIKKPGRNGFYVFTFTNNIPGFSDWSGLMYDYDNRLNINSYSLLANNFSSYFTVIPVDDSVFYLSGTWINANSYDILFRTGIMKMKTDCTLLDQNLFIPQQGIDTANNTAYRNSLDILSDGNLVLCSNHNIIIQQIPQLEPTYIRLIKLTPELDIVWERFIGDGEGKFDAFVMKTTSYDEIIILGAWSPAPPTNWHYTEPMFIKTNGEGLFTSIPEGKAWIKSSDAILYPNPANDQVTVEFSMAYRSAEFQLTDISGKTIFTTHLSANRQTVDISALQAGTYFYRISNPKGLEETGKLVVK